MANKNKKEFCAKTAIKSNSQGSLSNFHAAHTRLRWESGETPRGKQAQQQLKEREEKEWGRGGFVETCRLDKQSCA